MTTYDEYGIPVGAYSEPENLATQAWRLLRVLWVYRARPIVQGRYSAFRRGDWSFRRVCTLVNALVLVWWAVLYWGERGVFNGAVESCNWERWEDWEEGANPHRLVLIADPQLIDPHTYPGRPWPLNPLTYKYTDLYLRRTYSRFQTVWHPDTIFFLGDLFDGGREWSTRTSTSPEKQYRRYGDDFWMNEYRRFGDIFFKHWGDGGMQPRPGQPGRRIISSLPGNHDLGFARGVQVGVRDRFNAYFGDGNRIDIIANHTFVSIDSVSLSAFGQDSPQEVEEIWRPTKEFLSNAKNQKRRLIQRELRAQQGLHPYPGMAHHLIELEDFAKSTLPHADTEVTEFPTILLTHVPLYRAPGTPCGPLREHWPPTPPATGDPPLESDDRNAIAVRGGYQYQNVMNRDITANIAEKIGDIGYAFSGDDHDYCDVVHRGYASAGGGIREITVKSISWAMGVRRPGVQLVSLWNPVDATGKPRSAGKTVQTHLCLLPDQIGTFLTYAALFGLTLILLVLRAALVALNIVAQSAPKPVDAPPLLPTREKRIHPDTHSANSSSSSDHTPTASLQPRTTTQTRTRGTSPYALPAPQSQSQPPAGGKFTYPLVQHAGYYPTSDNDNDNDDVVREKKVKIYGVSTKLAKPRKRRTGWRLFWFELRTGLGVVLVAGGVVYGGLVWVG